MRPIPNMRRFQAWDAAVQPVNASGAAPAGGAAARLISGIQALAPEIKSRAAEIEAGRRIFADLLERLRSTGAFSMFNPSATQGWNSTFRRPSR